MKQKQLIRKTVKDEYAQLAEDHAKRQSEAKYISIHEARRNKLKIDWDKTDDYRTYIFRKSLFQ